MASQRLGTREFASRDFRRQLEGYGLTTAQILYRLPDHPSLLQTYVWQDYDLCPRFPVLNRFLAFWLEKLEGPLHSVTVAHSRLIKPAELRTIGGEFRLPAASSVCIDAGAPRPARRGAIKSTRRPSPPSRRSRSSRTRST